MVAMVVTKCIELATESIPGAVLQTFVFLQNPEEVGTTALISIVVSALCTGYTSAMISFDLDVSVHHRKVHEGFYGYLPDDNTKRGNLFILMTLICTIHNVSRTVGVALLAVEDKALALYFVGGEVMLVMLVKILRGDFIWWPRASRTMALFMSSAQRVVMVVVVSFPGCLHFRHPKEMGGAMFTMSLLWAQAMPFVALQLRNSDGDDMRRELWMTLICCASLWVLLSLTFFCSIDLDYLHTFFSAKTGPQYVQNLFLTSKDDEMKFDAAFKNRASYTKTIDKEVREWVVANIGGWRRDKPEWFKVEMIPDEFLPVEVYVAEGGAKRRRRSSVSIREMVGLADNDQSATTSKREGSVVHPETPSGDE